MKRRIPIYGKAVLVFLAALFVFLVVVPLASAPIPGQLFGWYVVTTVGSHSAVCLLNRGISGKNLLRRCAASY